MDRNMGQPVLKERKSERGEGCEVLRVPKGLGHHPTPGLGGNRDK